MTLHQTLIFKVYVNLAEMGLAFRKARFLTTINTNNGVERQNKAFKYDYLERHNHATLSVMLTVLVEEFLPDKYKRCVPIKWCYISTGKVLPHLKKSV